MNEKFIKDLMSLKGKKAFVTGGSGYLGTAISEALAELGSDVIIAGRSKEKGEKIASEINKKFNVKVEFNKLDINSPKEIEDVINNLEDVNILVNNAITWPEELKVENTSWNQFESNIQSGITSPFYITKLLLEKMKKNNEGNVINIGSMYGIVSPNFKIYRDDKTLGNALAYNASKSAIIQMTKYFAVHYAKWNIRVNCISPGPFPRPGTFSNGKEWFEDELKQMNPLHQLGEPWHLKGAIALLASDLGTYMTGQNITIDGGWTIW